MKCPHCFKQVRADELIERKNKYSLCPYCKKEVTRAIGMSLSGSTSQEYLVKVKEQKKKFVFTEQMGKDSEEAMSKNN